MERKGGAGVVIEVRDHGIGMTPSPLARMFERCHCAASTAAAGEPVPV